jgi:hypothetical protein
MAAMLWPFGTGDGALAAALVFGEGAKKDLAVPPNGLMSSKKLASAPLKE